MYIGPQDKPTHIWHTNKMHYVQSPFCGLYIHELEHMFDVFKNQRTQKAVSRLKFRFQANPRSIVNDQRGEEKGSQRSTVCDC